MGMQPQFRGMNIGVEASTPRGEKTFKEMLKRSAVVLNVEPDQLL